MTDYPQTVKALRAMIREEVHRILQQEPITDIGVVKTWSPEEIKHAQAESEWDEISRQMEQ